MLTIYGDLLSQPTRAVVLFCKLTKIPYNLRLVLIRKSEQRSPAFLAINPDGRVPAITDGDFSLGESHAILMYLARSRAVADHWYPKDLSKRAIVDRYLHWHHTNLRHAGYWIYWKVMAPLLGLEPKDYVLEESPVVLARSLKVMDGWLSKQPYIAGSEISIADLSALCELTQLELLNYDLTPYPKVHAWYQRLRVLPEVRETHSLLDRAVSRNIGASKL